VKVKGGDTNYISEVARINQPLRLMCLVGMVETTGMWRKQRSEECVARQKQMRDSRVFSS
jgi:hypothetical protein